MYIPGFKTQCELDAAMLKMEDRAYPCPMCGKLFFRRGALEVHMRIHTGDRPYKCDLCPADFNVKANFERHYRAKHMKLI